MEHINQFTDKFKLLTKTGESIKSLSIQVNRVLNRLLPARILSKANIFNMAIDVSTDLSNTILLHVEDSLVEQNMLVAQKELSVRGLATLSGHHAVRPISSAGIIKIQLNPMIQLIAGPNLILNNAEFRCNENNLTYVMVNREPMMLSTNETNIQLSLIEGTYEELKYVATGKKFEKISVDSLGAIEHSHVVVRVNGTKWTKIDALYDGKAAGKTYFLKNGLGSQIDIVFGNQVYGAQLQEGDVVTIEMLITSGAMGNISDIAKFELIQGAYDTSGNAFSLNEYATTSVFSGFSLGSNGEHIETTRAIAGYNSRSLAFIQPENLKSYLSRLSILSHIDVWTNQDDLIFNLLLLPNLSMKLNTWSEYFDIAIEDFELTANQQLELKEYINTSAAQVISSELLFHKPKFEKYVSMVYVNGNFVDKQRMKTLINESIAQVMLSSTFIDVDMNVSSWIAQSLFLESLLKIDGILQVNIDIVSELNEIARINGFYEVDEVKSIGSVLEINKVTKYIDSTVNPNIGFDELGAIVTTTRQSIPLMRGGFQKFNGVGETVLLTKPVYIFYKTVNGYEEL